MTTIHLKGRITESGELDLELPAGLPPGEARVTIDLAPLTPRRRALLMRRLQRKTAAREIPLAREWTSQELDEALQVTPLSGAEIVASGLLGGWADQDIGDGQEWVEELRRKRSEQRAW